MRVVNEEKQRRERSQIFHFDSSEVKQRSECSFNSSKVKHGTEYSQRFPFNSSKVKQRNEGSK